MDMQGKRKIIDQQLCDHVRILLAGGATHAQAARIAGCGEATICRIKKAGYDAKVFDQQKTLRRKQEAKQEEPQLEGQMKMELQPAEEKQDAAKEMRFQAAMVDRLIMELDKINDTLNMFLRVMRRE